MGYKNEEEVDVSDNSIAKRLHRVYAQLREAEARYHKPRGSVGLVAISKSRTVAEICEAIAAGQLAFGENYVQEALPKVAAIAAIAATKRREVESASELKLEAELEKSQFARVIWHYTGRMQSSKAKYLARHFHWVQSVTTKEHAELLHKYRSATQQPLQVCLAINANNEESKSGIPMTDSGVTSNACVVAQLVDIARAIAQLPRLKLRGLMAVTAQTKDFVAQRTTFERVAFIYHEVKNALSALPVSLDTLSMGMSGDFQAAIAAGATLTRVGTAIFAEDYSDE